MEGQSMDPAAPGEDGLMTCGSPNQKSKRVPEQGRLIPRPKKLRLRLERLLKIDSPLPFYWQPRVLCVMRSVPNALMHVATQGDDPFRISVNAHEGVESPALSPLTR
jgi:hypothetical protein